MSAPTAPPSNPFLARLTKAVQQAAVAQAKSCEVKQQPPLVPLSLPPELAEQSSPLRSVHHQDPSAPARFPPPQASKATALPVPSTSKATAKPSVEKEQPPPVPDPKSQPASPTSVNSAKSAPSASKGKTAAAPPSSQKKKEPAAKQSDASKPSAAPVAKSTKKQKGKQKADSDDDFLDQMLEASQAAFVATFAQLAKKPIRFFVTCPIKSLGTFGDLLPLPADTSSEKALVALWTSLHELVENYVQPAHTTTATNKAALARYNSLLNKCYADFKNLPKTIDRYSAFQMYLVCEAAFLSNELITSENGDLLTNEHIEQDASPVMVKLKKLVAKLTVFHEHNGSRLTKTAEKIRHACAVMIYAFEIGETAVVADVAMITAIAIGTEKLRQYGDWLWLTIYAAQHCSAVVTQARAHLMFSAAASRGGSRTEDGGFHMMQGLEMIRHFECNKNDTVGIILAAIPACFGFGDMKRVYDLWQTYSSQFDAHRLYSHQPDNMSLAFTAAWLIGRSAEIKVESLIPKLKIEIGCYTIFNALLECIVATKKIDYFETYMEAHVQGDFPLVKASLRHLQLLQTLNGYEDHIVAATLTLRHRMTHHSIRKEAEAEQRRYLDACGCDETYSEEDWYAWDYFAAEMISQQNMMRAMQMCDRCMSFYPRETVVKVQEAQHQERFYSRLPNDLRDSPEITENAPLFNKKLFEAMLRDRKNGVDAVVMYSLTADCLSLFQFVARQMPNGEIRVDGQQVKLSPAVLQILQRDSAIQTTFHPCFIDRDNDLFLIPFSRSPPALLHAVFTHQHENTALYRRVLGDVDYCLEVLYNELVKPLEQWLPKPATSDTQPAPTILVVSDGAIQSLPIHLFFNPITTKHLIEDYAVLQLPCVEMALTRYAQKVTAEVPPSTGVVPPVPMIYTVHLKADTLLSRLRSLLIGASVVDTVDETPYPRKGCVSMLRYLSSKDPKDKDLENMVVKLEAYPITRAPKYPAMHESFLNAAKDRLHQSKSFVAFDVLAGSAHYLNMPNFCSAQMKPLPSFHDFVLSGVDLSSVAAIAVTRFGISDTSSAHDDSQLYTQRLFLSMGAPRVILPCGNVKTLVNERNLRVLQAAASAKGNMAQAVRRTMLELKKEKVTRTHPFDWGAFMFFGLDS